MSFLGTVALNNLALLQRLSQRGGELCTVSLISPARGAVGAGCWALWTWLNTSPAGCGGAALWCCSHWCWLTRCYLELCKSILVVVRQRRREFREIAHLPWGSPARCHRTGLCPLLLFNILFCTLGSLHVKMTFSNLPALPALVQISLYLLQSLAKLGLSVEAEFEWRIMTCRKEPGSNGEGSAVPSAQQPYPAFAGCQVEPPVGSCPGLNVHMTLRTKHFFFSSSFFSSFSLIGILLDVFP